MSRIRRTILLTSLGALLAGAAQADHPVTPERARLEQAYRLGYRRGYRAARAHAFERLQELSGAHARQVDTIQKLLEEQQALRAEVERLRAAAAACEPEASAPEVASAEPGADEEPSWGGPVPGLPTGPYGIGGPLVDPRLVEAGAGGVRAAVERDVAVGAESVRQGAGVAGTWAREQGEVLRAGGQAVGDVGRGYADAARGLGEERTALGHLGHTVRSIGGGYVQGARRLGGQIVEGNRTVAGRAVEGAREVGRTWAEGTGEVLNAVRQPFSD